MAHGDHGIWTEEIYQEAKSLLSAPSKPRAKLVAEKLSAKFDVRITKHSLIGKLWREERRRELKRLQRRGPGLDSETASALQA